MMSSFEIMPKSPWKASPGWRKKLGVPVEASVAAILRPTRPDLPIPVTMHLPRLARIASTACTKLSPSDCSRWPSASISVCRARRATSRIWDLLLSVMFTAKI